ncbi:hypothetical protein EV426DRAFT_591525 [Tirmania nivea]|nr:hypothetical protein EV426DRAFT_591525 [Tirmania nivea]
MTSTPPPTTSATSQPPSTSTPTSAPNNTTIANASTPAPQPTPKRRPYEDPTDGERFQLYVHSQSHPELKQKDLVTWFAQSFGKEINQSTVSRALKRYRDNPPENPEVAGSAKSKRGGGAANAAVGSPVPTGNKRRKTGSGPSAASGVVVAGAEVEEEAASEQVQRENQQGRISGANGTAKGDEEPATVHVLPFQHQPPPAHRGRAAAVHHHHTLPPQQLQHVLPHPPVQQQHQGAPQAPMAGAFHPPPPPHNPHLNNHVQHHHTAPYTAPGAPGPHNIDIDSDSDSDVEGGNTLTNGNGTYNADEGSGFSNDDAELASLHRRYESILLRSVLASGGAPGVTIPAEISQLGENVTTDGPAGEGENGAAGNHPTLSRESLVMYVVGRNELVRSLQVRVAQVEREAARLRRKVARRDELIKQLRGGQA